jgi:hypothetical protein
VVAENWANRLSREPSRRDETSRIRFTARMEDLGACARFAYISKDVTVSSHFESRIVLLAVAVRVIRPCRNLRPRGLSQRAFETKFPNLGIEPEHSLDFNSL